MSDFTVDPRIGDITLQLVERMTGKQCEIVLLVFEITNENPDGTETISNPAMVTSLPPDQVEKVVIDFGEYLKTGPDHRIEGPYIGGSEEA